MSDINTKKIRCYKCRHILDIEQATKIMRGDECPKCETYLRCGRMCIHYDPSAYNECHEPVAERILDKEKSNFCEYFVFNENKSNKEDDRDIKLSAANSLFKD